VDYLSDSAAGRTQITVKYSVDHVSACHYMLVIDKKAVSGQLAGSV